MRVKANDRDVSGICPQYDKDSTTNTSNLESDIDNLGFESDLCRIL
ncbi:hypothetical protein [Helicobacter sp. MIT 05-5294]|nr:hypothetical protein [Helicobacter sp. MIT 05-5294]